MESIPINMLCAEHYLRLRSLCRMMEDITTPILFGAMISSSQIWEHANWR